MTGAAPGSSPGGRVRRWWRLRSVSRGQSGPACILPDGTRVGTAGLYLSSSGGLATAVKQLGG